MDEKIVNELIEELIKLSFAEDIGDGDHTTLCCIPADAIGKQKLLIKEEGILAGVDIARRVFNAFDPELKMEVFMQDGAHVVPGDVPFIVTGKEQSLLQTERLMLNIMQRMSGIATMTARYVKALEGTGTKVLDTRKTTPGMRILEKMAVKIGSAVPSSIARRRVRTSRSRWRCATSRNSTRHWPKAWIALCSTTSHPKILPRP